MEPKEARVVLPRDVWQFLHQAGVDVDYETGRRFHGVLTQLRRTAEEEEQPNLYIERNPAPNDGLVVSAPRVPVASFCPHHLLPWVGWVSITYKPGKWVLGVSKFKRAVDYATIGMSMQEDATKRIHTLLSNVLEAPVTVEIRAMHTCAVARGVKLEPDFEFHTKVEG